MGQDVALEFLVISDIHREYLPWSPTKTIGSILRYCSVDDLDFVLNLGDNSGRYSIGVRNAVDYVLGVPYVSVVGNHDVNFLDLNNFKFSSVSQFYTVQLNRRDRRKLRKGGYGVFGKGADVEEKVCFREYYTIVEGDNVRVGLLFRHYPFNFNREFDREQVYSLVKEENVDEVLTITGHRHASNIVIEGMQKDLRFHYRVIPVYQIITAPFTLDRDGTFNGGMFRVRVYGDGSLGLSEILVKGSVVRERTFQIGDPPLSVVEEVDRGNLVVVGEVYAKA